MNILSYDSDLRRYAKYLTQDRSKVDDLVQTTYMKAYGHLDHFDGKNMKAWLFTIMKFHFINQVRKESKITFTDLFDVHRANDNIYSYVNSKDIEAQINKLNNTLRTTFLLALQGYQYEEIAEKLDVSLGTVKSRIFNAREKLSKSLI